MKTYSLPLILVFALVVVFGTGCLPPPPGAAHPKPPTPPGAFINPAPPANNPAQPALNNNFGTFQV